MQALPGSCPPHLARGGQTQQSASPQTRTVQGGALPHLPEEQPGPRPPAHPLPRPRGQCPSIPSPWVGTGQGLRGTSEGAPVAWSRGPLHTPRLHGQTPGSFSQLRWAEISGMQTAVRGCPLAFSVSAPNPRGSAVPTESRCPRGSQDPRPIEGQVGHLSQAKAQPCPGRTCVSTCTHTCARRRAPPLPSGSRGQGVSPSPRFGAGPLLHRAHGEGPGDADMKPVSCPRESLLFAHRPWHVSGCTRNTCWLNKCRRGHPYQGAGKGWTTF